MELQKLVLASNNAKKLGELSALLAPMGFELIPQGLLQVPEAEEPYPSFVENALTKARHAARLTGLPALADDSGLCVDALGGAPGVVSARYAGEPRSDERNNDRLLVDMAGKELRACHFYCVLVLVRHAEDPQPLIAEGELHGELLSERRGHGGFGYDPLMWLPQLGKTVAELSSQEKNEISHRALALKQLTSRLASRGFVAGPAAD